MKVKTIRRKKSPLKTNADSPNKVAMNDFNKGAKHKPKKGGGSYDRREQKRITDN